jgi:hypothetical protein
LSSTSLLPDRDPDRPGVAGSAGRLLVLAVLALVASLTTLSARAGAEPLRCVLHAPARVVVGAPVPLRFVITNRGAGAVSLLEWNTPFEGWFGAYVEVTRDGVALPYRGPMLKRAEPSADEYLRFGAGQTRRATVDLSAPFDLSQPGLYRVQPRITLHDVSGALPPQRARAQHEARSLVCNGVELRVVAKRGRPP